MDHKSLTQEGEMAREALGPTKKRIHPWERKTKSCAICLTLLKEDSSEEKRLALPYYF